MKTIFIFVYNDMATDSRVMRSIDELKKDYYIELLSIGDTEVTGDNINHHRVKKTSSNKKNLLNFYKAVKKIFKTKKFDIILGHDYYSLPMLYYRKITKGKEKMIYDAHELLYDGNRKYSFREKVFLYFEKKIVNSKIQIIEASEKRAEIVKQYYKLELAPFVIENISLLPEKDFSHEDKAENLFYSIPQKRLNIIYVGNIAYDRGIERIIKEVIHKGNNKVNFIAIGTGENYDELFEKYNSYEEIRFVGKIPYSTIHSYIKHSDLGFVHYGEESLNNKYCASNKVFEYGSLNKPIIYYPHTTLSNFNKIGIEINDSFFCSTKEDIEKQLKKCKIELSEFLKGYEQVQAEQTYKKAIKYGESYDIQ